MTASKKVARRSARKIVRMQARFQTVGEGTGVVKAISKRGGSTKLINQATQQVRGELGKKAAKKYKVAATRLDNATSGSGSTRKTARKAANKTAKRRG